MNRSMGTSHLPGRRTWRRGAHRLTCASVLLVVAAGCSGGTSEPPANTVATVEVIPNAISRQVGETVQLGVALKNANGELVAGHTVSWSSSNQVIASVSTTGLVTALALGTTTITATAGGRSGTAQVTVEGEPVASVTVLPGSDTLLVGETLQLAAELRDAAGGVITGRTPVWSSSNNTVATVSASGLVTAVGDGVATIAAASGGVNDGADITVFGPCSVALFMSINVGDTVDGALATSDCQINDNSFLDGYLIIAAQDVDVQIDMASTAFDTWLELWELVDPSTVQFRAVNDDVAEGNTDSRIEFTLQAGTEYLILANSFDPLVTGAYQLTVMAVQPPAGRVASPVVKRGKVPGTAALRPPRRR